MLPDLVVATDMSEALKEVDGIACRLGSFAVPGTRSIRRPQFPALGVCPVCTETWLMPTRLPRIRGVFRFLSTE